MALRPMPRQAPEAPALPPGAWRPSWRVLRDRDAFPGEDVAKVPVNQLAQAKARWLRNALKKLVSGRFEVVFGHEIMEHEAFRSPKAMFSMLFYRSTLLETPRKQGFVSFKP